jgi:hypothetical protein
MRNNRLEGREERGRVRAYRGALLALTVAALLFNCGLAMARRNHAALNRVYVGGGAASATGQVPEKGIETMGQASDDQIKIDNPTDAPLVIREVRVKRAGGASAKGSAMISVTVANTTSQRITSFGLALVRNSRERAYTERSEVIGPNGTYSFDALALSGKTSGLMAKIKGVRFADGSEWGEFSPAPPPPTAPNPPAN